MEVRVLNGNELVVQGGLEAGFSLYTGYPGSPLADYFNILYGLRSELKEKGIQVAIANSEANAAAMASGAQQAGRDTLIAMKSMGLQVAADALSVGNFADPTERLKDENGEVVRPGVVVVVGDDPWSISTSAAVDSRYLYKHLHIPFLEPATPQELKDWIKTALYISRRTGVYQGVLLTTFIAEGGGKVDIFEETKVDGEPSTLDTGKFDLQKLVMVPPNSLQADIDMIEERFPQVTKILSSLNLDQTFGAEESPVGFISAGVIFETIKQVLEERDLLGEHGLLKVASSYPLIDKKLLPWLKNKKYLVVVEEKRGFLQTELMDFIGKHKLEIEVFGKNFREKAGFPAHGGLNYEIINTKVKEVLSLLSLDSGKEPGNYAEALGIKLPPRLPTFCPGCPHRETLSLLKDLRQTLASEGVDLISHGDVGCYSLSFLPPFKEMHNLSAMGQGGALGAGVDIFTKNPSIVLMGDSTFYHSGITDISNSVQLKHDITYILLDNDNTAMTGHQVTPVSGVNVQGEIRPRQDMLKAVEALGVDSVQEVNPSDRYFYQNLLREFVSEKGVKVIVSNKECALTFHGRKKARDRKVFASGEAVPMQQFYQINTDVCEDCRECVEMTGCPGLTKTLGAYGEKVAIDPQICVADSYCTKIKACPSFELVEVLEYHPTKYKKIATESADDLPMPKIVKNFDQIAEGKSWRAVVTGVGGSGVTTISRLISRAAAGNKRDDLHFKFIDQKGLAQRNGRVTGHLSIYKKGSSYGALTPQGSADLLLSPDLLDGADNLHFLSPTGLALLGDDFQVPLSIMIDRGEKAPVLDETALAEMVTKKMGDKARILPLRHSAEEALGRKVYASSVLLGATFQSGRLPFSLEDILNAYKEVVHKDELENNITAFHLGRRLFLQNTGDIEKKNEEENSTEELRSSLREAMLPWQAKNTIMAAFERNLSALKKLFPDLPENYLAQYLHDIYIYDRGSKAENFVVDAGSVAALYKDNPEEQLIALRTIARTYWVKDEVFVAHQMVSPMQRRRDRQSYQNLGKSFRKVFINRPSFDILGRKIEFDLSPKSWMLKTMRHLRILRMFMPSWHKKERFIADKIREQILRKIPGQEKNKMREELKKLENIKGYRQIRYQAAEQVFGKPQ